MLVSVFSTTSRTGPGVFGALASNLRFDDTVLNVLLEGDLIARSEYGKKCHMPSASLDTAKSVDAQMELANCLNIQDPLTLRLKIPRASEGREFVGGSQPLQQVLDLNKGMDSCSQR